MLTLTTVMFHFADGRTQTLPIPLSEGETKDLFFRSHEADDAPPPVASELNPRDFCRFEFEAIRSDGVYIYREVTDWDGEGWDDDWTPRT